MAEVDQYIAQRKAEREQIDAILTEAGLDEPSISYELQGKPILGRERYYEAHQELAAMINGQQPLNLKRAVFLVESAYNPNLTWKWFDDQIENMVQHVGAVMAATWYKPSRSGGQEYGTVSILYRHTNRGTCGFREKGNLFSNVL